MNYDFEMQRAIRNNIISAEDIYDYRNSPLEVLLGNFYNFCRENLEIQRQAENLNPSIFVYTNYFNVNARAALKNGHYVISFNLGLLQHCYQAFHNNKKIEEYFRKVNFSSVKNFDNPINILGFQICTQFTYYHELAHLYQFTKLKEDEEIQERNDEEDKSGNEELDFNLVYHILEINADTYASLAVTSHIIQYIESTFRGMLNTSNAKETIIILGCCLLNYILSFSDENEDLYFERYKHPHSFVRQLNAILTIVQHLCTSPLFLKQQITLDSSEIFAKVVETYQDLEYNGVFETKIGDILTRNQEKREEIANYLYLLLQFDTDKYQNAVEIWNRNV